jgi:hypothetical protein
MSKITYEIVRHDGGWAYKVDETFSEAFRRSRVEAHWRALKRDRRDILASGQVAIGTVVAVEFTPPDYHA